MAVTADTKFTIADIASTLTSTPPAKTSVSTITSTSINTASISNIEIVPKSDIEVVPNVKEFTTNVRREVGIDDNYVVLGNGIFDKLMETATEHLAVQFANGRIRGEDYSTAYIQIFQATLQAALTAWLQKGLNEKQLALELASKNAELKLQADVKNTELKLQADIKNAELKAQTDVKSAELELQADLSKNQGDLQWAIALLQRDSQEALVEAQVKLTDAQVVHLDKQGKLLTAQTAQATTQAELLDKQGEHLDAQIRHLDAQAGLPAAQIELLDAQVASEESKRNLYKRQIEGFDEDYKQKILKICMDSWAVGFSVARDSFEASGIPAPMQKTTIDSLYNQYVVTELDKYNYSRPI